MKKIYFYLLITFFTTQVMASSETNFTLIKQEENFAIRHYDGFILVKANGSEEYKKKANDIFGKLFDYIQGNNQKNVEIAMTVPVLRSYHNEIWNMSFIMPEYLDFSQIPQPNDKSLIIKSVNNFKAIIIEFSGRINEKNINDNKVILQDYAARQNIELTDKYYVAIYNPPWTLPFMRRNEIIYKIKESIN